MGPIVDNLRIQASKVLLPPAFLDEEIPASEGALRTVYDARKEICSILCGDDRRVIAIVGPCSIHDPAAAREYAALLRSAKKRFQSELCVVMRVYFEKPRTTLGWKGLINDPYLDSSFRINDGLRLARRLVIDLGQMGMPCGTEFLDMIIPQYLAGLVSWGAIGARTTESQLHRQLVSGLSCPVGFKNGTSGNVQIAIEAIQSAAQSHTFLGHTKYGQSAIFVTTGNPDCHIILRGGNTMVNYDASSIAQTYELLKAARTRPQVMIDCSHANSRKNHRNQRLVCHDVIKQIKAGDHGIIGVMLESNLLEGAQKLETGKSLVYGQSVTDACIGWDETFELLDELAAAVRSARNLAGYATYFPQTLCSSA